MSSRSRLKQLIAVIFTLFSFIAGSVLVQAQTQGGTLNLGLFQAPRHLNSGVQSGMATAIPAAQLFASLLRYDEEWNPQPYLATEWEWSEDGKTFTAKLRDDAVFHDGEPITSEDVAFSIMAAKKHHPFNGMFNVVESVDTPDPHTVVFNLEQPHPALLIALSPGLSPILPKHIYDDGQELSNHPRNSEDVVGSGPFKFKSFAPGKEIVLERFDDFFIEDRPYLDRVVFQVNEDQTTLFLGLQQGNLQVVPFISDVSILQMVEADPSVDMTERGYEGVGSLHWLAINTAKEPFDDVRVRQAIAYAIDRDFIIEALTNGFGGRADGPIISSSPYATDDRKVYELDLEKAGALLDEAGYEADADGTRFSAVIDIVPGVPFGKISAEYIRQQLRKIGIDAQLRTSADFPSWAQRIANHDFDMTTDSVFNWGDPVIGVHRTYLSSNIRNVIWTNTQSYKNDRVDELLAQAAVELDDEKRKELYKEFQQIVAEEVPIIHTSESPVRTLFRPEVGNVPQSIWGTLSPFDEVYIEK